MGVTIGVLGPVTAWDDAGPLDLRGPRHRAVLARLVAARGRVVPLDRLVDDLWERPPAGAVPAVRTFVAALRRSLEPGRAPRTPAHLLVTDGPGYALRADADAVDAWRFEDAVGRARDVAPGVALDLLDAATSTWRGPAYAGLDEPWARTERARLAELRLAAVERRADAQLALGRPDDAVADLDAHVTEHPWRESGWRLLALALYRAGRQADALAVLRQARSMLAEELGVDPGPQLNALETEILRQTVPATPSPDDLWTDATAAYQRTVAAGSRARLESTVGLLRTLAVAGGEGLTAARSQRLAAVAAAEQLGDPELTARVVGAFDVPGVWTVSDEPAQAEQIVAAAERTLAALPPGAPASARARLLATIALESRGIPGTRGPEAAREAELLARGLDDPAVLAFALAGRYLQSFERSGLAPERDALGAELIALSARHGLTTFEIFAHLVRMQALSALGRWDLADEQASAAAVLGRKHERPLVDVFIRWYGALRTTADGAPAGVAEAAYRDAATTLDGSGMPGLAHGLLPLALLCLRVWRGLPADFPDDTDWGPYAPWARPLVMSAQGRRADAVAAARRTPVPPPGLLQEALWCLAGRAAVELGDRRLADRARTALAPAVQEIAGAGSGVLTAGPVALHLAALDEFLGG